MNIQQSRTQFAQLGCRGRYAVDPAPAFSGCVHGSAQQQFASCVESTFGKPALHVDGRDEFSAQVSPRSTLADQTGVCASAQDHLQGIDQNGFSSPRLTREGSKSRFEIDLQCFDDDEIAQGHALQRHGQEPPSFQRSFRRKVSK